jgi:hypothetical protein
MKDKINFLVTSMVVIISAIFFLQLIYYTLIEHNLIVFKNYLFIFIVILVIYLLFRYFIKNFYFIFNEEEYLSNNLDDMKFQLFDKNKLIDEIIIPKDLKDTYDKIISEMIKQDEVLFKQGFRRRLDFSYSDNSEDQYKIRLSFYLAKAIEKFNRS